MKSKLLLLTVLALPLAGCGGSDGLPQECEDYITKINTVVDKLPAEIRATAAPQLQGLEKQMRDSLATLKSNEEKANACKQADAFLNQMTGSLK